MSDVFFSHSSTGTGAPLKILMIVPHFAPDLGPSAPLFTMLSHELAQRGHHIVILTTVPHYPSGEVPQSFRGKFIQYSTQSNQEIIRIRVPSLKRSSFPGRLLQFACYQIGATWAGLSKHYDVAFVANPALWVWLPFAILCALRRKPSIFSVYDVYPDVGIRLGIFKNKAVIAAVTALERFCLERASLVRIITESFRPAMRRLGVPDSKISVVHDWVDTDLIQPLAKDTPFIVENGLSGQFIVLYAGNLGLSQGLETILTAAQNITSQPDVLFLFVGDGSGRNQLEKEVETRQLSNVRFLPFQPRERLPQVLASAAVSLVILKKGIGFDSIPSKIWSILASSRPLVISVDEGCEAWNIIQQSHAGLCVPPEDPSELAQAILTLKKDSELRRKMGENGRIWALEHHSPQAAAQIFENLFRSLLSSHQNA